jgi:hypothetical protein
MRSSNLIDRVNAQFTLLIAGQATSEWACRPGPPPVPSFVVIGGDVPDGYELIRFAGEDEEQFISPRAVDLVGPVAPPEPPEPARPVLRAGRATGLTENAPAPTPIASGALPPAAVT